MEQKEEISTIMSDSESLRSCNDNLSVVTEQRTVFFSSDSIQDFLALLMSFECESVHYLSNLSLKLQ